MKSALALLLTAAPEAHEPQLIDVDATVVVQLGIFLLLLVVLGRWLWRPYLRLRTERVERVEGYREEAARLEADAQQRLTRADLALAEARGRLSATLDGARKTLEAQSSDMAMEAARKILGREVGA